jgi:peptidoglycan/LPS O-acetylase OafA/YrhL
MRVNESLSADASATDASIPISRPHLAALDGARFIAAFCVLAGHGYWYVVAQQADQPGPLARVMRDLPGVGMTLFFVLSGFVIHLNYHKTVGAARGGTFDFFIARFARLYPLFLAVFAIDFLQLLQLQGYAAGHPRFDVDLFGPLPFFLSLTQSWLFIPFEGHPLYEHYAVITSQVGANGAMWSISTEWLFYAVYPLLSARLARRHGGSLAVLAGLVGLTGLFYYVWCAYHVPALQMFAMAHFHSARLANEFIGWVVFYSPLGRITEFLLGAVAAQYFVSRPYPKGLIARHPLAATTGVAAAFAAWYVGTSAAAIPLTSVNASCGAIAVAAFVLLIARFETPVSRLLAHPLLVKGGEASYSLYLLHFFTLHQWTAPYAFRLSTPGRVVALLAGMLISLALARVVYLLFEQPSRRWLRRNFKPLRLHLVIVATFVAITCLCVAAALQTVQVRRFCAANAQVDCTELGIVRSALHP